MVKVFAVQKRPASDRVKRRYNVRYTIDGRHRGKAFPTKAEAERYRSELLKAVHAGVRFDEATGEPESWLLPLSDVKVHEWVRRWLAAQWPEWQPRTRSSTTEALSRFVALSVTGRAAVPEDLRHYLQKALRPDAAIAPRPDLEQWLDRNALTLADLTQDRVRDIADKMRLKLDGTPLAPKTSNRYRINCHDCVLSAVEAGAIPFDPWPRRKKTSGRKKVASAKRTVQVRQLPGPAVMARAIAAMAPMNAAGTKYMNPRSRMYQVMTAVAYYAGLRPSEVVMLRVRSLLLPDGPGWGHIDLTEADIDWDVPGEPKTGPRVVPIPPVLITMLREWIDYRELTDPDQLLFRTSNDARPGESTWGRAWHRALKEVGQPPLRPYDCRHAAATTWLRAGVPLGEVARRLGHSVQTLVSTYVGALEGDEEVGNARIEAALADQVSTSEREPALAATG